MKRNAYQAAQQNWEQKWLTISKQETSHVPADKAAVPVTVDRQPNSAQDAVADAIKKAVEDERKSWRYGDLSRTKLTFEKANAYCHSS